MNTPALTQYLVIPDSQGRIDLAVPAGESATAIVVAPFGDSDAVLPVSIVLARNASLKLYVIEDDVPSAGTGIVARLDADSRFDLFVGSIDAQSARTAVKVHLDGPGAEAELSGMAILSGTQRVDTQTLVLHHVPHCTSRQTFKFLVSDTARGSFNGLIKVEPGAHHTEAYQTNRNMLASQGARMETQPQLEIYCDDVKCSHGAATGQLDEQALFYMRSRGIGLEEARSMLMNAFMADVIEKIQLEPLREELKRIVAKRLLGNDSLSDNQLNP